jgi:phenylacetate-CoA ligase
MEDVTTKAEDVLTLADGRLISPSVLTHPFKPLDCIEGSQIVQTLPNAIVVRLIPRSTYTEAHGTQLIGELKARLGDDVTVDVQFVDQLETSKNGKFKWVISKVPLGL